MKKDQISNRNLFAAWLVLTGLLLMLVAPVQTRLRAASKKAESAAETSAELRRPDYGKLPLLFEENRGQTDRAAKFVARAGGYALYLAETEAVFSLKVAEENLTAKSEFSNPKLRAQSSKTKSDRLRMKFAGANLNPKIEGGEPTVTKTNYYIGKQKYENLTNYRRINYRELYKGIDAVFYGNRENQLEYDFVVEPNADANQIRLNFDGAKNTSLDEQGNLLIKTANAEIVQQKPFAFQIINGERREVAAKYVVENAHEIAFALGEYDRSLPLTIDPVLSYLTYVGGTAFESAAEVAADAQGNAYIAGSTASLDFHGETRSENDDKGVFAAKLSADGSQFLYITILEGNGEDFATSIALDSGNNAVVAGVASRYFPTTSGAFDTNHGTINAQDGFVTKLNGGGSILSSTFLGAAEADGILDIAIDANNKIYAVGSTFSTTSFPLERNFQGCGSPFPMSTNSEDSFLTVFNGSMSAVFYSTCIGGSATADQALSVSVDAANNAYVVGRANGGNFPTKNAAQSESGGGVDAWLAKFNPVLSGDDSLVYSTYLGGSGTDIAFGVAVNSAGQAFITGVTGSTNFPLMNAFRAVNQINEAFVAQYGASGNLLNSTFLGGSDQDQGNNIALGNGGTIYVVGDTLSNNFPTALPFQAARAGGRDAFIAKIRFGINNNPGVSAASYLGGAGNDLGNGVAVRGAHIFVAGNTESSNLATTAGVVKGTSNASATNPDAFVSKILDTRRDTIGTFEPVNTIFKLKNSLTGGAPDITVNRGVSGDIGVAGDFNGDGVDTVSTFNSGVWKISNLNVVVSGYPTAPLTVNFGAANDLPVVGDWNGDGIDTIGVFRPSAGQFFLTNSLSSAPPIDLTITFGQNGDLPVAGDWNGDGIDSIGVFRKGSGQFFLTNQNVANPTIDVATFFGTAEDAPVAGDFDGNGTDTIGVYRTFATTFFLTNDNINISNTISFGAAGDTPVIGDWNGRP